ncbi:hypothetical protein GOP47_0014638 [Adiantum capillus-veneris]|uniref:Kinesin motor domain-containing protein n=1 Tax=Adiantum capillus-veneris TaxID=13818 RepID=A0A9D4UM27_ADICA|nr:hypothetical protein GOP47_0014638 [Adiantum capillus-veneris]
MPIEEILPHNQALLPDYFVSLIRLEGMAPSPASRFLHGSSNGQRTPPSTSRHKERHRMAAQPPSFPFPSSSSDHPVEVIGRIRDHAEASETACMLQVINEGQTIRIKTEQGYRDFGLDGVSLAKKGDLQSFYEKYVESRIDMVKMGARCTIMMYGPTGAGKSYTMFGSTREPGIAYQALEKILGGFANQSSYDSSLEKIGVNVTILEIYNEEAFDLLAGCSNTINGHWTKPSKVRLDIMGKKVKNAVCISGSDAEKICKEIAKVEKRRVVKSTLCNERSSRSHCLVMVDVPTSGGRLVLVDMAGSENLEQAGLGPESKLQTGKINQGNIALKRVVEAIANGDSYIPFRDSKLTMLLQDSFEDIGSKILMVLCASTEPKDMHKTIGTLEYGSKAKCIVRLPTSPDKKKTNIDKVDLSNLEAKVQNMDAYIIRLEAENILKDKEREEMHKKLMHRDHDLVALRKVLGQIEPERCGMVDGDDCKAEMERKLEECQRIADELIELGKKSLEEKVLQQQREIELMRCRMEEIEKEVQLLLKANHQPCSGKKSQVSQKTGYPSGEVAGNDIYSSGKDEEKVPCYFGSWAVVADKDTLENATDCSRARECRQAYDFNDGLNVQVCNISGRVATSDHETFEISGCLPTIPEESEGEDSISDHEASHQSPYWNSSAASEYTEGEDSILKAPIGQTLSILQENSTLNTGLVHELVEANRNNEKSCELTSSASRRSRIENIFMLCGNQRELIGTNPDSANKEVTEHRHLSRHYEDMSNQPAVDSPSSYVQPAHHLPSSTEELSGGLDSGRKLIASPKCSPVHSIPLKSKPMSSDSSPMHHNMKHSSLENTPPHGRSPIDTSSLSKTPSFKSPRKLSFDGLSPLGALMTTNQQGTDQDADSCEVFVKWETSKDSCGKLIKILSMDPNASLALLRKDLESNVLDASQDFTFLMLQDPTGTPAKRANEINLSVASLPNCHKKQGSKLACLRPHRREGITTSPLTQMEKQIITGTSLLCMGPSDISFGHLKSPERSLSCQIIDGTLTPHPAEDAKIKQKLGFSTSPLLKGLRL